MGKGGFCSWPRCRGILLGASLLAIPAAAQSPYHIAAECNIADEAWAKLGSGEEVYFVISIAPDQETSPSVKICPTLYKQPGWSVGTAVAGQIQSSAKKVSLPSFEGYAGQLQSAKGMLDYLKKDGSATMTISVHHDTAKKFDPYRPGLSPTLIRITWPVSRTMFETYLNEGLNLEVTTKGVVDWASMKPKSDEQK